MFYSVQILNKKGPLGVIWIAAHLDRRLKRSQVNDTSIPSSVGEYALGRSSYSTRCLGILCTAKSCFKGPSRSPASACCL